jgi:hypothetical protein
MNKQEIIEMIKQTDLLGIIDSQHYENESWIPDVVKFAKLIAEKEREACAKICDEFYKGNPNINYSNTIAICIRGRTRA